MDECKLTRIHGRFGWKAMPLALEDLDSNLVNMLGVDILAGDQPDRE